MQQQFKEFAPTPGVHNQQQWEAAKQFYEENSGYEVFQVLNPFTNMEMIPNKPINFVFVNAHGVMRHVRISASGRILRHNTLKSHEDMLQEELAPITCFFQNGEYVQVLQRGPITIVDGKACFEFEHRAHGLEIVGNGEFGIATWNREKQIWE